MQSLAMIASASTDASALIGAVASLMWPVVLLVAIFLFRKNIAERVGRLQSFKAAGAEMTFSDRADQLMRDSGAVIDTPKNEEPSPRQTFLIRMAATDPRAAIRQAWLMIRDSAMGLAKRMEIPWKSTDSFSRRLVERGLLDSQTLLLILNLRRLYYDIENHPEEDVTPSTAAAYVAAAGSVADAISAIQAPSGGQV
jgi:hypothetical protein